MTRSVRRIISSPTQANSGSRLRREASASGFEIASMDQGELFGVPLHTLTFARAIAERLLTDYVVAVIGVSERETMSLLTERRLVQLRDRIATDAASLGAEVGLLKAIRTYGLRRTISFHSRIARASQFAHDVMQTSHIIGSEAGLADTLT